MEKGRGAPAEITGLLPTHERVVTVDGKDVAIAVADTRTGRAFYPRGTGPFTSNRAARRSHYRGVDGKHDGSKKPTRGRVSRTDPPWRGAPL